MDNAVELMVRRYIGLPKRITMLSMTRKDLQEVGQSFLRRRRVDPIHPLMAGSPPDRRRGELGSHLRVLDALLAISRPLIDPSVASNRLTPSECSIHCWPSVGH